MRILVLSLFFLSLPGIIFSSEGRKKRKKELVLIQTQFGDIKLKLYDETPLHKENFLKLIEDGFYENLLFHRVINNFMIQGGDLDSKEADSTSVLGNGGPGYTIDAEIVDGFYHKKGALAAARLGDDLNPDKKSSGSQFYIVHGKTFTEDNLAMMEKQKNNQALQAEFKTFLSKPENEEYKHQFVKLQQEGDNMGIQTLAKKIEPLVQAELDKQGKFAFSEAQKKSYTTIGGSPHLDGGYTVFGEVIEGLEVIDNIAAVAVNRQNRPLKDVRMNIKLVKK